ncbi:MAG: hypothetical protein H7330_16380 [Hymenobacteraceae bacterium]|nr:hypothetical protein [Hymenobacteraceae bacterium]
MLSCVQMLSTRIKAAIVFGLLAYPFSATAQEGAVATNARTIIPARQTFVLGGNQSTGFQLTARNTGRSTVELLERTVIGDTLHVGFLKPQQEVQRSFALGTSALVRNPAAHRVVIRFQIIGDFRSLPMYYLNAKGQHIW